MILNQNIVLCNNYMDFQRLNQVHDLTSRQVSDSRSPNNFDLNLMPETTDSDDEVFISQLDGIHISQASHQNHTDQLKQEVNINSKNLALVLVSAAGDPTPSNSSNNTSSTIEMVHSPFNPSNDRRRVHSNGSSLAGDAGRNLGPRRPPVNYYDLSRRVCTNFKCRTRNTPMWRKGPLGPKTLCNACGIQYKKQVARRGSSL